VHELSVGFPEGSGRNASCVFVLADGDSDDVAVVLQSTRFG
jgi:hypothetical protein